MLLRTQHIWFFSLALFSLLCFIPLASAADPSASQIFCRCICFDNSTIIPLYPPSIADSKHPCLSCTKSFCLDQKLDICKGATLPTIDTDVSTGKEGDVEARCFKRDSPRDQIIVTVFLFVVVGLLGTAFVRNKLEKSGVELGRLREGGFWIDAIASLPARAGAGGGANRQQSEVRQGAYAPVSVGS